MKKLQQFAWQLTVAQHAHTCVSLVTSLKTFKKTCLLDCYKFKRDILQHKLRRIGGSERSLHHSGALWGGHCGNKCRNVPLFLLYYYTVKAVKSKIVFITHKLFINYKNSNGSHSGFRITSQTVISNFHICCFLFFSDVTASKRLPLYKGEVKELATALCSTMDRRFLRMEYNTVLSETAALDPRLKRTRIYRQQSCGWCNPSSLSAPPSVAQEEEAGGGLNHKEAPAPAVWRLFNERAAGAEVLC